MQGLEFEARDVGDGRDRVWSEQPAGQEWAAEQAALLGGGFALEDEARAKAYHSAVWMLCLEGVEQSLDVGLLPAVGRDVAVAPVTATRMMLASSS